MNALDLSTKLKYSDKKPNKHGWMDKKSDKSDTVGKEERGEQEETEKVTKRKDRTKHRFNSNREWESLESSS